MSDYVDPIYQIFDVPIKDLSHCDLQWRRINTDQSSLDNTSFFEFRIPYLNEYILPSHGYLKFRVRVRDYNNNAPQNYAVPVYTNSNTPSDQASIDAHQNIVTIVNNAPLFYRGEYIINNQQIENVEGLHRCHYVKNLLDYSQEYSDSQATTQFWYPDTGQGGAVYFPILANHTPAVVVDDASIVAGVAGEPVVGATATLATPFAVPNAQAYILASANLAINRVNAFLKPELIAHYTQINKLKAGFNVGYRQRLDITTGGDKITTIEIPLSRIFGFHKDIQKVFFGHEHSIRLTKNQITDIFHSNANGTVTGTHVPILTYLSAELWIPSLKPSLKVEKMISNQIANNSQAKISWEACYHQQISLVANTIPTMEIQITRKRPFKLIFFLQNQTDVNSYQGNPCRFINGGITSCRLEINGRSFPELQYEGSFTAGSDIDITRFYNAYLECTGKRLDLESSCVVNYNNFSNLFTMFCFNLSYLSDEVFASPTNIFRFISNSSTPPNVAYVINCCVFYEENATVSALNGKIVVQK